MRIVKRFTSPMSLKKYANFIPFVILSFLLLLYPNTAFSQLTVNPNVTAQDLVSSIIGPGYNVSNVKLNCQTGAFATFTSTGTNLGLTKGILLTTGKATNAIGPNNNVSLSTTNGTSGDSQLDAILGTKTTDGCALEFDLIPSCDTLKIKYAFGSEEYPEYVGADFNDVFSFFISGPGITGSKNIATLPNTNTPVSINTVNANTNSQYFNNNANGTTLQYDGLTKPLTAWTQVVSCSTYHLKIVIADVEDAIFDSGVFIEGGSITCSPVIYNNLATNVNGVRGCKNGSFTFCRTGDRTSPYVVNYTIGGTAVNGVDYQMLPGSVTIPAGQECATVEVVPLPSSPKPLKTIEITYKYGFCPEPNTIVLTLSDPIPLNAGPDKEICSGDSVIIGLRPIANTAYSWSPTTGLSDPTLSNPSVSIVNNTNTDQINDYIVRGTVLSSGCVVYDTVRVTVKPHPTAVFSDPSPLHCFGTTTYFRDTSYASAGKTLVDWYWNFGNNLFDTVKHTNTVYPTPGAYNVTLTVTDNTGCTDDTTMLINIWPPPIPDFNILSSCIGDSVSFKNTSKVPNGVISDYLWSLGDGAFVKTLDVKHLYAPGNKNFIVQLFVTSDKGCIEGVSKPLELFPKPTVSFVANSGCIYKELRFSNYSDGNKNTWTFGDSTSSNLRNPSHIYATSGQKNIKLVVANNYGCTDSLTKPITVYSQPKFDFYASDTVGCPIFITNFTAVVDSSNTDSISTWKWVFNPASIKYGEHVIGVPYQDAGKYSPSLVATNINGCSDTLTKEYYIHVYPIPTPSFLFSPNELSMYDMKTQIIDNSSSDVVKWEWDLGDGIKELNKTKFSHDYKGGNEPAYTVSLLVTNQHGCQNSTTRTIYVRTERAVFIPNAFTPNGDGLNDQFMPFASGDYLNADYQMRIFDRWGNKLLFSGDINQGWNGTYKGGLCERDVYVYSIIFTSKEDGSVLSKFKGIVTLVQ